MRCAVKSCKNKYVEKGNNNKSFFKCPKDNFLRLKWIEFVGSSVLLSGYWRVCEDHFSQEDVIGQLQCDLGIKRQLLLRVGAVPTIASSSADENLNSVYADDKKLKSLTSPPEAIEQLDDISELESDALENFAGYLCHKLKTQGEYADFNCNEPSYTWVDPLNEGGLTKPSPVMIEKMNELEKMFRQFNGDELLMTRNFLQQHLDVADSINCSYKVKKIFFRSKMYFNIRKLNVIINNKQ